MPSLPGPELVDNVRKIAVLRAGGIGDFIFTLPALHALRAAYPEARITLLGEAWHEELLSGRPGPIGRALAVPRSTGVNGPDTGVDEDEEELERFFTRMREERFDLALQLHGGGGYSNPFVRKLGARVTAGTKTPEAAGVHVAVVGIEEDRPLIFGIVDAMSHEVHNLCGRLSLRGLAGILSRCAVVVSNDSGPLHLGTAVGAATVGIYWGPNLINAAPPTRSRHRPALSWRSSCPVCGATLFNGSCGHQGSIVADVRTEEVADFA